VCRLARRGELGRMGYRAWNSSARGRALSPEYGFLFSVAGPVSGVGQRRGTRTPVAAAAGHAKPFYLKGGSPIQLDKPFESERPCEWEDTSW